MNELFMTETRCFLLSLMLNFASWIITKSYTQPRLFPKAHSQMFHSNFTGSPFCLKFLEKKLILFFTEFSKNIQVHHNL